VGRGIFKRLDAISGRLTQFDVKAKLTGVQAADFNGLSNTYGYVRAKAKAMVTAPKKN
jgi:hypothetical protein